MPESVSVRVERLISAPSESAFDAWLDAESAALWLFATPGGVMEKVQINPRVGGEFEIVERRGMQAVAHYGAYQVIDRPYRIVFDFRTEREGPSTRVTVRFESVAAACLVTLLHDLAPEWAEYADRTQAGWQGILQGLERALTGLIP